MRLAERFARGFERAVMSMDGPKPCGLQLVSDTFDGKTYTIDEFYDWVQPYFSRPAEFFRDFAYAGAPNLRPESTAGTRSRGNPDYDALVFDAPLPTEWQSNNRVPFKWFYAPDARSKAILLFAPGWARANQQLEVSISRRLRKHGIDVGLMTVPFHQERAPAGSYSGEYFISPNLFWTIANFRQFTAEIRLLVQYMRQRYAYVGLIGLSSGGFQAGLATLGEPVDFLFPIMTGCRLGSIVFRGTLTRHLRADLERRGIDEGALTKVWSITDLQNVGHASQVKYRKQYITAFDSVIPPEFQEALWQVYGRPERFDLATSHYSVFFALPKLAKDIATYVHRCIAAEVGASTESRSA